MDDERDGAPPAQGELVDPSFYDALRRDPPNGSAGGTPGGPTADPQSMKRQIAIDRATLEQLVTLFERLSSGDVDADALRQAAAGVLAAITGETFNPGESAASIVEKRKGVTFPTKLLEADFENPEAMSSADRTVLSKRIQDAGRRLNQFLLANEQVFKTTTFVWMDLDLLP
jgi:hypothetical protein